MRCQTGKVMHSDIGVAQVAARNHHRTLNREGQIAMSSFAYKCRACRSWHLMHLPQWNGRPNKLVRAAAPIHLQRWAMPWAVRRG